jgi:GNAT superfamily N-acetyltransferase
MFIRLATPNDAERLATVHVEAWKSAYRGQVPDAYLDALSVQDRLDLWRKLLADETASSAVLVLVDGDLPVGFAYCTAQRTEPSGDLAGELASMYVDPRVWRQGGGRLLMAAAIEWFTTMACLEAMLWVLDANTGARRFYERLGWKRDGSRKPVELGGSNLVEVRYRLEL